MQRMQLIFRVEGDFYQRVAVIWTMPTATATGRCPDRGGFLAERLSTAKRFTSTTSRRLETEFPEYRNVSLSLRHARDAITSRAACPSA